MTIDSTCPPGPQFLIERAYMHAKSLQSCPTLCNSMDCSPPGSSVYGILQERILAWVAMPSSRGSSQARDQIRVSYVSCIGRQVPTSATWEAPWITITACSLFASNFSLFKFFSHITVSPRFDHAVPLLRIH